MDQAYFIVRCIINRNIMNKILFYIVFIAVFINLFTISYANESNLSLLNFYIGQPYWDVYENIKEITKTNEVPNSINFSIRDISTAFDSDLNLVGISIPFEMFAKNNINRFYIDDARSIIEIILKPLNKDKINIKKSDNNILQIEEYNYTQGDSSLSFSIIINKNEDNQQYATFSSFVLEKIVPLTGPIIKKLQLGQPMFKAHEILDDNNLRNIYGELNKRFYLLNNGIGESYSDIPRFTNYLVEFGFSSKNIPSVFGVDRIDDDFINKFIVAYNIEGNFISYRDFCVENNIPSDYILGIPNTPNGKYDIMNSKILKGDRYYIFFIRGEYKSGIGDGIYIVYDGAIPFVKSTIPPYNRPKFD